jgi:hypothetical protein
MLIKIQFKLMVVFITTIIFFVTQVSGNNPINNNLNSSAGSIEGILLDAETKEPIGWINLLIDDINRSVSAHADGSFHFYNIPAGRYKLKTFRVGYRDAIVPIEVIENDTIFLKIQLTNNSMQTSEIIVEADKYSIEKWCFEKKPGDEYGAGPTDHTGNIRWSAPPD